MNKRTQEKMLMPIKNNMFYRIKKFFMSLFCKKEEYVPTVNMKKCVLMTTETELLRLQKRYSKGEIKEEDLTEEQMDALCELYDKQIENLLKSNAYRKQKIMAYWEKANKKHQIPS